MHTTKKTTTVNDVLYADNKLQNKLLNITRESKKLNIQNTFQHAISTCNFNNKGELYFKNFCKTNTLYNSK